MRLVLESRLTAADMLRKTAEHERQEKEESAQLALLEQEAMMEKVVQESKRLQQAADENSKVGSVSFASKPIYFFGYACNAH